MMKAASKKGIEKRVEEKGGRGEGRKNLAKKPLKRQRENQGCVAKKAKRSRGGFLCYVNSVLHEKKGSVLRLFARRVASPQSQWVSLGTSRILPSHLILEGNACDTSLSSTFMFKKTFGYEEISGLLLKVEVLMKIA